MKPSHKKNFRLLLCLYLCGLCFFTALAPKLAAETETVKVPVKIALSHPIAGAQFKFHHTDGLEFVSFEKSEAVGSAMMTPTVAKDGSINIGFFSRENNFIPQNGELNAGNLIFNYSGASGQKLAMTEVKLVEVIDRDHTKSELLTDVYEISVPVSSGKELRLGFKEPAVPLWIVISAIIVIALLCLAGIVIIRQRKMLKKQKPLTPHL